MNKEVIKNKIYTIRGLQVMLDRDLAELYEVPTKRLNEQVKRNIERFPKDFMFQLTISEAMSLISQNVISRAKQSLRCQNGTLEAENLKSQNATSKEVIALRCQNGTLEKESLRSQNATLEAENLKFQNGTLSWGGTRKLPYVFTEQGVAALSGVLKSKKAVQVNIQIIRAFVAMRQLIAKNQGLFIRLDNIERKQIQYDENFEKIFQAIDQKQIKPKQGIFFNGQIFDAYTFVSDLIRNANESIILIDNYIDDSVLTLFSKRKEKIKVTIYTKEITNQLKLDLNKFNSQYQKIEIKEFKDSHDRFMIIDNKETYHIGASLKDLGKKWFAFSKFDKEIFDLLNKRLA